ncbi:hypothetical protein FQR65_LT07616 [Abscondita terminalis]|nr:hypothetical protein FQR65_LT07616 [Abscondita terminalis]
MEDFVRPDLASRCTWKRGIDPNLSPHTKVSFPPKKIRPNVLHVIGNTPMVRLNRIPQAEGIKCEMLAKCEFYNPGGSVKDRIGFRMVEDAENAGLIKPGYTIIEPTSGNTGIGLAMASAVKGYRCIIVMPEKMSNEKVCVLRSLGAEIVRTPTSAAFDSPEGLIAVSQRLQKQIPNSIILNQYTNAGNPLAHYDCTAAEIYEQCDGKLDMIIVGAGTGGTVCGVGRKLKELCPNCVIVSVDPEGSILAEPESLNDTDCSFYELEGIGYDFIPTVLDRSVVDEWYKVKDVDCFTMARRLIKDEGLLCGGSSGAAMHIALKAAARLKENQRCVVLLPDGIRNYLTKFISDYWLEARNFKPIENVGGHWWWDEKVSNLKFGNFLTMPPSMTCSQAIAIMKKEGVNEIPIVDDNNIFLGIASLSNMMSKLMTAKVQFSDPITSAILLQYRKVNLNSSLGLLSRILDNEAFVLVVESEAQMPTTATITKENIIGVVSSPMSLLNYISENSPKKYNKHVSSKPNKNCKHLLNTMQTNIEEQRSKHGITDRKTDFKILLDKIDRIIESDRQNHFHSDKTERTTVETLPPIKSQVNTDLDSQYLEIMTNILLNPQDHEMDESLEKELKDAYTIFEKRKLPSLKQRFADLPLVQLKEMIFKEWQISIENPLNSICDILA